MLHLRPTCVLILLLACSAGAEGTGSPPRPVSTGEPGSGQFLFHDEGGRRPAPLLETFVAIRVTGLVARTEVIQRFENPSEDWVEGIYVFPLPEDAAVDRLQMQVGPRFLEGEIHERAEAKRVYEKARAEGKKAALLEQERPNLFTSSVANLGPRETLFVKIEYQEELDFDQGRFGLRFPMAFTPRYVPPQRSPEAVPVPDAARITPPIAPLDSGPRNPVYLDVVIDAGVPLRRVESSSHAIRTRTDEGIVEVAFEAGAVAADADFVLEWEPELGATPRAALFRETLGADTYALLMVLPPETTRAAEPLPREIVFVIDTSGSMSGASIQQATSALRLALQRLRPDDRVNVIAFANTPRALFPTPRAATSPVVERALAFVDSLSAGGGTEMASALELALRDPNRVGGERVRQVVFITDGAVGNEEQLFGILHAQLGRSRLFTVGIGSAPNAFFMKRAARFGRGTHAMIGAIADVEEVMHGLFTKLESPALGDLTIELRDPEAERWPARIPDLYHGEPVVVAMRLRDPRGDVVLRGSRGREPFELGFDLEAGVERPGVHQLFARRKIAATMDALPTGADPAAVRATVVGLGLKHHLVTRYTSLVAVEERPSAPRGIVLDPRAVPIRMPRGWRPALANAMPSAAVHAGRFLGEGPSPTEPPRSAHGSALPQTATPAALFVALGALLVATGSWLLLAVRRNGSADAAGPLRRGRAA